ncbi:MAG: TlpA family protein disulfide reductase [Flavobacteriales bacterium]|nr:TlpA family protein disulfide reductase [Flavobacteriales bacterium]
MKIRSIAPFLFALTLLVSACGTDNTESEAMVPRTGPWRMELALTDSIANTTHALPFLFDLEHTIDAWHVVIHNADESIIVDEVVFEEDHFVWKLPYFDTEFTGSIVNDSTLVGQWHNYYKGANYAIAFTAKAGDLSRFEQTGTTATLGNQWETHFGTEQEEDAIGLFHQNGDHVTGTFATETGDYRYLDGTLRGDSLFLSTFDGSHAFLFKALLKNDTLCGRFWSGIHFQEPWIAFRNPSFKLRNADSLTYLKEGYDMVDLSFPDIDGGVVASKAPENTGKVLVIQIMGSWCPNCVDESRLLQELYSKHHANGLNIISLAFERDPNSTKAITGLKRYRDGLDLDFPIALVGCANKDSTSVALPFLNAVMSYPTCIFIGRDGMVRRIHTGFYGPGTGAERYAAYKQDIELFVTDLLKEPAIPMASRL